MKEKIRKRKKVIITILVVCALIAAAGITYAFITQVLTSEKQVVINAGVLDLVLEEENAITISDALPMYDQVGMIQDDVFKFRLVNKTANDTNYILKLQEIETGTLDKSIVKYGLIKEEEKTIDFVSNIVDGVIDEGKIAGSDTIDYELRLWIDSSVTEITQVKSKFLSFKLSASVNQDIMFVKALDDIVIDFGLPVEIKQPKLDEGRVVEELSYATYGKVEIEGDSSKEDFTIRYIPTEILRGIDNVHLVTEDNKEYTFNVYPATTVYYEESIIDWESDWQVVGDPIKTNYQSHEKLNEHINNYGYDFVYNNNNKFSNGTATTANLIGAKTTFKFIGDGFQIFSSSTKETGYVAVQVRDSNNKLVKIFMVNTPNSYNLENDALNGATIVSVINDEKMKYGEYTVDIIKIMDSNPVLIDGIRIFNTINDSRVFTNDMESYPKFYEVGSQVHKSLLMKHGINETPQYSSLEEMANQVFKDITLDGEQTAAILTENVEGVKDYFITDDNSRTLEEKVQNLLNIKPKFELHLYKGQTLVFNITTNSRIQLGLKAPNGATNYQITVNGEKNGKPGGNLNSSVDMFYSLKNEVGAEKDYTITITNTGDNILSITNLKICNDPDAKFNILTETDIEYALTAMGYNF